MPGARNVATAHLLCRGYQLGRLSPGGNENGESKEKDQCSFYKLQPSFWHQVVPVPTPLREPGISLTRLRLECNLDSMPWTKPLKGPARVTAAGKVISGRRDPTPDLDMDSALSIAGNWRSSHGYPLHVFKTVLRNRAKKFDPRALVAQRLKRLPSVITKLQRFHTMQLSTMQDLGGCRAVVRAVSNVDGLVQFYKENPPIDICINNAIY